MTSKHSLKRGDHCVIEYSTSLPNGTVLETEEQCGCPKEIVLGEEMVLPRVEQTLVSMAPGERQDVLLSPEEAYGPHNPELVQPVPLSRFADPQGLHRGSVAFVTTPTGQHALARILDVKNDYAVIDMNHPLAGKEIRISLRLVDIVRPAPKALKRH